MVCGVPHGPKYSWIFDLLVECQFDDHLQIAGIVLTDYGSTDA